MLALILDEARVYMSCLVLQIKYPSALASFEQIANVAKGKQLALFLDYDGTLSQIVDNPDHAFMSNAVRFYSYSSFRHGKAFITKLFFVPFPLSSF